MSLINIIGDFNTINDFPKSIYYTLNNFTVNLYRNLISEPYKNVLINRFGFKIIFYILCCFSLKLFYFNTLEQEKRVKNVRISNSMRFNVLYLSRTEIRIRLKVSSSKYFLLHCYFYHWTYLYMCSVYIY